MSEVKKRLRAELLGLRRNMEKSVRKDIDEKIYNNLIKLDCVRNCETFLVYVSLKDEVDTRNFITEMIAEGKTVALPKCIGSEMQFIAVNSLDGLVKGRYGVVEPADGTEITVFSDTVCIVPALRFDKKGYRLGWGGGFYDRFLSGYNGISVGLCYNDCCGDIPIDDHDVPTDIVLTENGIYYQKSALML